jgi:hypothetical protein
MPGIALDMEGAVQQAPQLSRQFIGISQNFRAWAA